MNARVSFSISNPALEQDQSVLQWLDYIIGHQGDDWLLGSGKQAKVAVSCLLAPAPGDRVICMGNAVEIVIAVIVQRESTQPITLGRIDRPMRVHASEFTVTAGKHLSLGSGGDCDITAPCGVLSINCRDLITQVFASWIQSANHCVARFDDWTTTVKQLIRTHSQRQLITAEKELKVDADVIHMG